MNDLKIAIVCDWLTSWGGAERVILALHRLYPDAPIYTSLYDPTHFPELKDADVRSSFLQRWPGAKRHHQWYLSFMPAAFESFDLSDYNIVISSSHSCAKGVITKPETLHISYCHSPTRYLWDGFHQYVAEYPWPQWLKKTIIPRMLHRLRIWDRAAADRVDCYVANSRYVASRIKKYYRRDAEVIHPPVQLPHLEYVDREQYFLAVGRLIPYKRFDLIVDAFNHLKLPLKVVGVGNQLNILSKKAGPSIEFLGMVSEDELIHHYRHAQALLFPQIEDFGITPVEAMGQGCPVIAYAHGGALETVHEGVSGLFFKEQTVESLIEAVERFQRTSFDPKQVRHSAEAFCETLFEQRLSEFVLKEWDKWRKHSPWPF